MAVHAAISAWSIGMKSCTSPTPSSVKKRVMRTFVSGKYSCLASQSSPSGAARRSRPCPCRGSRRTRSASRTTGSSTSRSCRWCRRARSCADRRRGRARRSGGSRSRAPSPSPCRPLPSLPRGRRPSPRRAPRPARRGARAGSSCGARGPGTVYSSATRSRGLEQQVAGGRDAAADDDLLRVEQVDRVGDPDARAAGRGCRARAARRRRPPWRRRRRRGR